jgi:hypothetical protein
MTDAPSSNTSGATVPQFPDRDTGQPTQKGSSDRIGETTPGPQCSAPDVVDETM